MDSGNAFIASLVPRDDTGFQFICYADACSGVPGAPHEQTFASVNAIVSRFRPAPEFICFPGDEIRGLTTDAASLKRQWEHWFQHEMAWLDRQTIPLYHTTANHTTYDAMSEAVFREVLPHLPRNGPPGQEGLSYFIRRRHLLMVFVNTMFSGLGGEGYVETDWLRRTLTEHSDATYKLVFGHHPVHPVNGFSGPHQREIARQYGREFWQCLVEHQVMAYFCSHILAFDVQVHDGTLQILTAGAGTAHRMPEGIEYLHCVQAAIDARGLRYQVLDTQGRIRERLNWPMTLPDSSSWKPFVPADDDLPQKNVNSHPATDHFAVWRFRGRTTSEGGTPQTLLCGRTRNEEHALPPLWIGLQGREQRLGVLMSQAPERSPHLWIGPELPLDSAFDLQIGLHTGMGPGGVLFRWSDASPWSSLQAASPWGPEQLRWPDSWSLGQGLGGSADQPFRGRDLRAHWHFEALNEL